MRELRESAKRIVMLTSLGTLLMVAAMVATIAR